MIRSLLAAVFFAVALLHPVGVPAQGGATLEAAVAHLERGELLAAERLLRSLLAERRDAAVHDLLGVTLVRQERFAEGERQFLEALAVDPDLPGVRQHLARLYLRQGRDAEAVAELRRAAAGEELERDLSLRLAVADLEIGLIEAAEARLRAVAERFDSVRALMLLARLERARDAPAEAWAYLEQARALSPNAEAVLEAQARAAFEARLPVRAILALEPLVRMHPSAPDYPYRLGIARLEAGDVQGAVEALATARELDPSRASTHVALGLALNGQNRYDEAWGAFETALAIEPTSVNGLAGAAEAALGLGNLAPAERLAVQALAREPRHATAALTLGMLRLRQERYAEARDNLLAAVAADPGSPKAHYQLSLAFARLGDETRSREELDLYREAKTAYESQLEALEGANPPGKDGE